MTAEDKQDAVREEAVSHALQPVDAPAAAPAAAAEDAAADNTPAGTAPDDAPQPSAIDVQQPAPADAPPAFNPYAPPSAADHPPYPAAPGPYGPALVPYGAAPGPYGAQPPYGGYWGPAPYSPPRGLNGFSIAALVTALTCFLWPLGIAFGITGLVQIRKRNQRGTGLAVSGLLLSGLGLLGTIGVATTAVIAHNSGGSFTAGGSSADDLTIGDCFNRVSGGLVNRVPCATAHDGEVVGHALFTGQAYPDAAERKRQVGTICSRQAQNYAMDDWAVPDTMLVHYFYPEQDSWASGDRNATCFWIDPDEQHTGSVRKDASNTTAAQLGYLKAMDAIDEAASGRPSGSAADDPDGYRDWAGDLAGVLRTQTAALDAAGWDPDVRTALNAQLAELRQRIPALQQAADSTGVGDLARAMAQADQHRGYDQQKAVRQLLQLSTDDSWLNQPSQGGASPQDDGVPQSV